VGVHAQHASRPDLGALPQKGSLQVGTDADFTVVDPNAEWVLDRDSLHSKSKSTPFDGERFVGKPTMTVVRGTVTYEEEAIQVEEGYGEPSPPARPPRTPIPRRPRQLNRSRLGYLTGSTGRDSLRQPHFLVRKSVE